MGQENKRESKFGGDKRGKQVFVGNIPYTVTWQQLKDVFRECGNVLRADVPQDERVTTSQ